MNVKARFWYDGQHVDGAREDAAYEAVQRLNYLVNRETRGAQDST